MTLILGMKAKDGTLYLGGDSAGITDEGYIFVHARAKVFRRGDYLIGCAGSHRFAEVVRYTFKPPEVPREIRGDFAAADAFMVASFAESLREAVKAAGLMHADETNGGDRIAFGSGLIVGLRGVGLYYVACDFAASRPLEVKGEQVGATGGASEYALAALAATHGSKTYRKRLRLAFDISLRFYNGVRAPFSVLELKP